MQRVKLVLAALVTTVLATMATTVSFAPNPSTSFPSEASAVHRVAGPAEPDSTTTRAGNRHKSYTIRARDTLTGISLQIYGTTSKWPMLWWLNRDKLSSPNMLVIGTVLTLHGDHPSMATMQSEATGG